MEASTQLWIVPTPIGNLQDISYRAVETLKAVDWIICEDSRETRKILDAYKIPKKPLYVLHRANEARIAPKLIERLQASQSSAALVSDAGTPTIRDPGSTLIRLCHEAQIRLSALPGPCAAMTALSLSGCSCDRFVFEGFLPKQKSAAEKIMRRMALDSSLSVFYETPHRLRERLVGLQEVLSPTRRIMIGKELTKLWESISWGSASELIAKIDASVLVMKGEMVVLIEPEAVEKNALVFQKDHLGIDIERVEFLLKRLKSTLPLANSLALVSEFLNIPKKMLRKSLESRKNQLGDLDNL